MPSLKSVQKSLRMAHRELNSWRKVGARFNISPAMAFRMAERDYEPKTHTIRHTLGLPSLVKVAPCKKCGDVHLPKYCRNSVNGSKPASKVISIGKPTPAQEAKVMALSPAERLEKLLE